MGGDNDGGEAPARPAPPMNIKFSDVSGFEVQFRLKPTTKLGKAMEAFSARTEKEVKSLRFLFEGDRVLPDTTPESLGLEDGDTIEVHLEQLGGGKVEQ